jgi:hypothetical protein
MLHATKMAAMHQSIRYMKNNTPLTGNSMALTPTVYAYVQKFLLLFKEQQKTSSMGLAQSASRAD